jgi:hypothetical protein
MGIDDDRYSGRSGTSRAGGGKRALIIYHTHIYPERPSVYATPSLISYCRTRRLQPSIHRPLQPPALLQYNQPHPASTIQTATPVQTTY